MSTCTDPGQEKIRKAIRCEQKLNGVVITVYSPKMNGATLRCTVSMAGLNPFLYEMASIREFASWCHPGDCGLFSNLRYFQAMLISTASQKRKEAVERRMIMVIEDVVE